MRVKPLEKQARDINSMQGQIATKMSIKEVAVLKEKIDQAVEEYQKKYNIVENDSTDTKRSLFSEDTKSRYCRVEEEIR